jgi:hypothetical protein
MWLVALIPELFDALAAFIGATWWQLPLFVGLWKVEETLTSPPPAAPPAQQSPVQQVVGGAGAAVAGAGQAVGSAGSFFSQNAPWLILGGVALVVLTRR